MEIEHLGFFALKDKVPIYKKELSDEQFDKMWDMNEHAITRNKFIWFLRDLLENEVSEEILKKWCDDLKIGWCEVVPLKKPKNLPEQVR